MTNPSRLLAVAALASAAFVARADTLKVTPVPAGITGWRAEYLHEMSGEEAKILSLAESIPAAKYTWRPGPGVRSVSELLLHVAAANFNLPKLIGTPPPEGFVAKGYDKSITDKAQVIEAVRKSFAHLRAATVKLSDADGEKTLKLFGDDDTYRGVHFFMLKHLAEHLGQLIAYARMNSVVPAWSE